jgi:hypothetical protein
LEIDVMLKSNVLEGQGIMFDEGLASQDLHTVSTLKDKNKFPQFFTCRNSIILFKSFLKKLKIIKNYFNTE